MATAAFAITHMASPLQRPPAKSVWGNFPLHSEDHTKLLNTLCGRRTTF